MTRPGWVDTGRDADAGQRGASLRLHRRRGAEAVSMPGMPAVTALNPPHLGDALSWSEASVQKAWRIGVGGAARALAGG